MSIKSNKKIKIYGLCSLFRYLSAAVLAVGISLTLCFALPHSEAKIKMARDYINLSQYNKAYSILSEVIETEESTHEAFYLAGLCMQKQNNDIAAEKLLKKAYELKPDDYDTKKLLSALYLGFANQAQSSSDINRMYDYMLLACRVNPSLTQVWRSVFERWFNEGRYDLITAEGELLKTSNEKALVQGEDAHLQAALFLVAKAWFAKQNTAKAERFVKYAAMIRQPNDNLDSFKCSLRKESEKKVNELADKAKALAEKGRYKEAIEVIQKAQKIPGIHAGMLAERKEAYTKELNFQAAITKLNRLESQKKYVEILEEIPNLLLEFPDNEKLLSLFDSINEKLKKEETKKEKANIARAAEQTKRRELISKYNAFIRDGQKEEKQKNYLQAVIWYENALKLRPDDEKLKNRIAAIKAASESAKARERAYLSDFSKMTTLFAAQKYKNTYESALEMLKEYSEHKDDISVYIAESALRCGLYKEASDAAECLKYNDEKIGLYNYIKGMSAYNLGRCNEALEFLNKIKKPEPSFTGIKSALALIYIRKLKTWLYVLGFCLLIYILKAIMPAFANKNKPINAGANTNSNTNLNSNLNSNANSNASAKAKNNRTSHAQPLDERIIKEMQELKDEVSKKSLRLSTTLMRIKSLTKSLDRDQIFNNIVEIISKGLEATKVQLLLNNKKESKFIVVKALGLKPEEYKNIFVPYEETSMITHLLHQKMNEVTGGAGVLGVKECESDPKMRSLIGKGVLKSILAAPVYEADKLFAIINVEEMANPDYTRDDQSLLATCADIAGLVMKNAKLYSATIDDLASAQKLSEEQLKKNEELRGSFSRIVSPSVAEMIMSDPSALKLGGNKCEVSVFFSDIRGFTKMSENMDPTDIVEQLNVYFTRMTSILMNLGGTLDKYVGDELMALFGAPIAHDDDPIRAVLCGVRMLEALRELQEVWKQEGKPVIQIGIGINTGIVTAGYMGSENALSYTVIGDNVNLAARIMAKALGMEMFITRSTYERVKDYFEIEQREAIMVKGKSMPIEIFCVKGAKEGVDFEKVLGQNMGHFAKGINGDEPTNLLQGLTEADMAQNVQIEESRKTIQCSNCGAENNAQGKFCAKCGMSLF